MSWDVVLMNIPTEINEIKDITEDNMGSLGSNDEVVSILQGLFPDADFSDPSWGTLERSDYSIEFNISLKDINCILLHIRGNDDAIEALRLIYKETGWKALDGGTGIIDFDNEPERGLHEWQQYRDHVLDNTLFKKK
ncbi:hypothetical protein [Cohnella boryungensis]|uniref:DUF3168 domain-containing protein n=1 Tax=Cohnella boryungensis TaxID=768479 RepID=A0ABV8SCU0_9BACL